MTIGDIYDFVSKRLAERDRRENGPQLCRDAADLMEAGGSPDDLDGTASAIVQLLRKTAWMGDLDPEYLARVPCDEVLTLAEEIIARLEPGRVAR